MVACVTDSAADDIENLLTEPKMYLVLNVFLFVIMYFT